jgi:pilus assembly protein Flp/PilA
MALKEAVLKRTLLNFFSDESGATAIEYGLIAAGIAVVIIGIVKLVGQDLIVKFTAVDAGLK